MTRRASRKIPGRMGGLAVKAASFLRRGICSSPLPSRRRDRLRGESEEAHDLGVLSGVPEETIVYDLSTSLTIPSAQESPRAVPSNDLSRARRRAQTSGRPHGREDDRGPVIGRVERVTSRSERMEVAEITPYVVNDLAQRVRHMPAALASLALSMPRARRSRTGFSLGIRISATVCLFLLPVPQKVSTSQIRGG